MTHPFIEKHGWTIVKPLPQDGSARSYIRLEKKGESALFMNCGPLKNISPVTSVKDFIEIGNWISSLGLRTPKVYESDLEANVAIIEDFGDISMKMAMENGEGVDKLYDVAAEILNVLQSSPCPLQIPAFHTSFMRKARQRFVDWYVPVVRKQKNPDGFVAEYHAMWDGIESTLDPYQTTFMHVDYHVENLMFLPGQNGTDCLGIIDFQEGMIGPTAYDLVNLLEDMRADVPLDIQKKLKAGYDENFLGWYRLLGTQFHTRLLGQCLRWAIHDNKPQYLKFYPRLLNYTKSAL